MPRRPAKSTRIPYHRGYLTRNPCGSWTAEITRNYRTVRKTFPTRPPAEGWIDQTLRDAAAGRAPLTDYQQFDARSALQRLPPGVTLTQAADAWLKHHAATTTDAPTLADAIRIHIDQKIQANMRSRTIADTRSRLAFLLTHIGDIPLNTITTQMIESYLSRRKGPTNPKTRNAELKIVATLMQFAARRGWVDTNPCTAIVRGLVDETMPEFLTVDQTRAILYHYAGVRPDAIPLIAIGLFAGLRTAEIRRLHTSAIADDYITVGGSVAKLRAQRLVIVTPALTAWLTAYPPRPGLLADIISRTAMDQIHTTAQLTWPHNALRHTYATYHLAMWGDPGRTAGQLGHTTTTQLFRHYRGLATRSAAEEFWALRP